MSFENLKLNKQLLTSLQSAGISAPFPLQTKVIPRIASGQEIICLGAEKTGKSTALVLSILMRLKFAVEEAPRALVLVADKERVLQLVEKFTTLGEKSGIRVLGLYAGAGIEGQKEAISDGVDVVVGTPDRVLAIYLKSALNLNRLQQFVLDDAELIVKQGFQSQIHQISLSLPRCQRLAFAEVMHDKLERLLQAFMTAPSTVEVDIEPERYVPTVSQLLYLVPNYKTKQNLLNLLMSDADAYPKVILFVNTRVTAQNLYKSMHKRFSDEVALLRPPVYEYQGFKTVDDFKKSKESRILVVANEIEQFMDLTGIAYLLHFDLPSDKELFIRRVEKKQYEGGLVPISITFSTDIELSQVKKIEVATGQKMQIEALPPGLIIEGNRKKKTSEEEEMLEKSPVPNQGAFHEKKASNAKDYNWGWKEKNKLFGKKYKNPKRKQN